MMNNNKVSSVAGTGCSLVCEQKVEYFCKPVV